MCDRRSAPPLRDSMAERAEYVRRPPARGRASAGREPAASASHRAAPHSGTPRFGSPEHEARPDGAGTGGRKRRCAGRDRAYLRLRPPDFRVLPCTVSDWWRAVKRFARPCSGHVGAAANAGPRAGAPARRSSGARRLGGVQAAFASSRSRSHPRGHPRRAVPPAFAAPGLGFDACFAAHRTPLVFRSGPAGSASRAGASRRARRTASPCGQTHVDNSPETDTYRQGRAPGTFGERGPVTARKAAGRERRGWDCPRLSWQWNRLRKD